MSFVTNYVLFVHDDDEDNVTALNSIITEARAEERPHRGDKFNCLKPAFGGTKYGGYTSFGAAMNHFRLAEMIGYIQNNQWNHPDKLTLMYKTENMESWVAVNFEELRFK